MTYLFYGKPSYKVECDLEDDLSGYDVQPVCFLFKSTSIFPTTHAYFGDTGAYFLGLYAPYLSGHNFLNWTLAGDEDSVERHISEFFGSHENYYTGKVPHIGEVKHKHLDYHSFLIDIQSKRVLRSPSPPPDDRAATIELQIEHNLSLADLECIICPRSFRGELENIIGPFLAENPHINVDDYPSNDFFLSTANEGYHFAVRTKVWDYLKRTGRLPI